MDEKLGLNFIECEENSDGEVSASCAERTESSDICPPASAHTDAAARWCVVCAAASEKCD